MNRVLLIALALLASSVAHAQPDSLLKLPLRPLTPSKRGVVFKAAQAREFGRQCSRISPIGWWTLVAPSKNEIKRLEHALPGWIKAQKIKGWSGHFGDYFYQYGAFVSGKTRLIYVNAVPAREEMINEPKFRTIWRRVPETVCDGGPDFWGVEFNPLTSDFQNVGFNGMA